MSVITLCKVNLFSSGKKMKRINFDFCVKARKNIGDTAF